MQPGGLQFADIAIFLGVLMLVIVGYFLMGGGSSARTRKRIQRITERKTAGTLPKSADTATLRRKSSDTSLPMMSHLVKQLPSQSSLRDRLERAGMDLSPERYVFISIALFAVTTLVIFLLGKPVLLAALVGLVTALALPHFYVGHKVGKRQKEFLILFPDAIDLIVRGLRSGLPVAESIGVVAREVAAPVGPVFASVANSVKLGVTLEKALQETGRKLQLTEFNFFVTSIILQRETGGNLGEILNNLSEVLRKRFMMRMKIRAMSSEARASATIVGALPFVVLLAVHFTTPGYLEPLFNDYRGNIAGLGACVSMALGIGIMVKMTKFEI